MPNKRIHGLLLAARTFTTGERMPAAAGGSLLPTEPTPSSICSKLPFDAYISLTAVSKLVQ
jgi:hypothetical protein